jgi:hypothetical protein
MSTSEVQLKMDRASEIEEAALEAFKNAKEKGHIDIRFEEAQNVAQGLYILLDQQEEEKKKLKEVLRQERLRTKDMQTRLNTAEVEVQSKKDEVDKLEEIERTFARESAFMSASALPLQEPKQQNKPIWIYIVNMINLWQKQRSAVSLAEKEPKWNPNGVQVGRKVFFDLDNEGQIIGVTLEK